MTHTIQPKEIRPGMQWVAVASYELLEDVQRRCDRLVIEKGARVYLADDPPGGLFHIQDGKLDLFLPDPGLKHDLTHFIGPGWWAGDLAAISGQPRRIEIRAGSDAVVLRLSRANLIQICDAYPEMWQRLAEMTAENMRLCIDTLASLKIDDPTDRVAASLRHLARSGPAWQGHIPVKQSELASICNMSRRRIVEALSTLDARGVIRRERGLIVLQPAE